MHGLAANLTAVSAVPTSAFRSGLHLPQTLGRDFHGGQMLPHVCSPGARCLRRAAPRRDVTGCPPQRRSSGAPRSCRRLPDVAFA
jgi:hypothetical protein